MRILVLASEVPPTRSGVALTVGELIEGYRSAGHEVESIGRDAFPSRTLGEFRLSGVAARWKSIARRVEQADVVHIHGPAPTFCDAILLRLGQKGPPVLYTHHFDLDLPWLGAACKVYNAFHRRLALRRADVVVTTSDDYRRRFDSHPRAHAIPWGADHRPLPAPDPARRPDEPLHVLFVGQMRPYKGVDVLLDALRGVEGVRATLVGGGPLLERYRAAADGLGHVTLTGPLADTDLESLLLEAHVVTLPSVSRMEAFGMVLVEGMRAACIPVASALPGVRTVVGESGLAVPPGDSAALRAAFVRLRDDPDLRRALSEHAFARSRDYSWGATVSAYLGLLEAAVARRAAK